jgi:hypothetical protein
LFWRNRFRGMNPSPRAGRTSKTNPLGFYALQKESRGEAGRETLDGSGGLTMGSVSQNGIYSRDGQLGEECPLVPCCLILS